MDINYSKHITKIINEYPDNTPIFTEYIARIIENENSVESGKLKELINLNLKRLADNHIIERIQKGVYYKPKMTVFGMTKPPQELFIKQICISNKGKKIGYIGDEALLHDLGLTSLLPKNKVIVTNNYRAKICGDSHIV